MDHGGHPPRFSVSIESFSGGHPCNDLRSRYSQHSHSHSARLVANPKPPTLPENRFKSLWPAWLTVTPPASFNTSRIATTSNSSPLPSPTDPSSTAMRKITILRPLSI